MSDAIVIAADNTWNETTNYHVFALSDGDASDHADSVVSGTYTIANGEINFTMTAGGTATFIGSVTGNTLIAHLQRNSGSSTRGSVARAGAKKKGNRDQRFPVSLTAWIARRRYFATCDADHSRLARSECRRP